ncbi:MAG: aldehyde dehydrogenase family protein, partial [Calditrichia bacterium]|nr:aldehyde dehydrogenase family protein [Calditrichia bacterium]
MIKEYMLFINNEFVNGSSTYNIYSPYNNETVGTVHRAGKKEMLLAVNSSAEAFKKSKKLSIYERAAILEKLLEGIKAKENILAETIVKEGGKPIRFARNEVYRGQITIKTAIEVLKTLKGEILPLDISPQTQGYTGYVKRFPIGPVLGIAP